MGLGGLGVVVDPLPMVTVIMAMVVLGVTPRTFSFPQSLLLISSSSSVRAVAAAAAVAMSMTPPSLLQM